MDIGVGTIVDEKLENIFGGTTSGSGSSFIDSVVDSVIADPSFEENVTNIVNETSFSADVVSAEDFDIDSVKENVLIFITE